MFETLALAARSVIPILHFSIASAKRSENAGKKKKKKKAITPFRRGPALGYRCDIKPLYHRRLKQMMDKAIEKLTREMMEANDPLVTMLEEHLTNICTNDRVAEKLLQEGKTLKEVSTKLWNMASKRKQGSGAHIPDAECFLVAEEYYGITEEDKAGRGKADDNVVDIFDFL